MIYNTITPIFSVILLNVANATQPNVNEFLEIQQQFENDIFIRNLVVVALLLVSIILINILIYNSKKQFRLQKQINKIKETAGTEKNTYAEEIMKITHKLDACELNNKILQTLLNNIEDVTIVTDSKGEIEWTNNTYRTVKQRLGDDSILAENNIFKQKFDAKSTNIIEKCRTEKTPVRFSYFLLGNLGAKLWFIRNIIPFNDFAKIEKFIIIDIDITASKLASEEINRQKIKIDELQELIYKGLQN